MKNRIPFSISVLLILFIGSSTVLKGQKIEIIPFAGYQTSAKIKAHEGYFRVNDGLALGGSLALGKNEYKVELSYSRTGSSLTYYPTDNSEPVVNDLAVHYASIGGLLEFLQGNTVVPFVKIGIGGTYYQPLNSTTVTENVMHFDFSGGAKLYLSDHFGFRFQASLFLPVFFEGLYFEEAAPAEGEGMQTKIAGIQGNISTGVIVRF